MSHRCTRSFVAFSMLGSWEVYGVELRGLRLQLLDLVLVVGDLLLDVLEVPLADPTQTFSAAHAR